MERLTPLARPSSTRRTPTRASLAIGSLAIFEGPAPAYDDFVRTIEGRLPPIPRYRQNLRTVPLDLAAPLWVDDPGFDLRWHIRNTALPAPGGPAEIGRLLSRVMSRRMDRSRPLWEYWFCEGLDAVGGGCCPAAPRLVDGVSGTDLYRLVLDADPVPRPPLPDPWIPRPCRRPSTVTTAGAVGPRIDAGGRSSALAGASRSPRRLVRSGRRRTARAC